MTINRENKSIANPREGEGWTITFLTGVDLDSFSEQYFFKVQVVQKIFFRFAAYGFFA